MKLSTIAISISLLGVSVSTQAGSVYDYVGVYDADFNVQYYPLGHEEPNASISFLDVSSEDIEVKAYSEPYFKGDVYVFDYANMPTSFDNVKSYKVVSSTLGSYGDKNKVYFKMDSYETRCMDVSYFIPSMGISKTNIGTFCTSKTPQEIFDLSAYPNLKDSDVRFVVDSQEGMLVTGFSASLKDEVASIKKERWLNPSGYKIDKDGSNVFEVYRFF